MNIKPKHHRFSRGTFKRTGQSGVALLEALIAILIFSLGILTIVAIQATSIRLTGDAQLRTRASLLAERLIGQMWVYGGTAAELKTAFQTGGSVYNKWLLEVQGKKENEEGEEGDLVDLKDKGVGLPGVTGTDAGSASNWPTVTVDDAGLVVVTLFWKTPSMSSSDPARQHSVTTQIVRNN